MEVRGSALGVVRIPPSYTSVAPVETLGVSMSEHIYDTQIAPKLLEVAELCKTCGLGFAAIVEYAPGDSAVTVAPMPANPGAAMRVAGYGMVCEGNVDTLIGALLADAGKFGHSSVHLSVLQQAMASSVGEVKH